MPHAISPWSRLAFRVLESGANTLSESVFRTPVSATVRTGMQIRKTILTTPPPDVRLPAAGLRLDGFVFATLSLRQGQAAIPAAQDSGVLHTVLNRVSAIRSDVETAESSLNNLFYKEGVDEIDWAPSEAAGGLIIATANLSLYVLGSGNVGAKSANVQIYYRLVELSVEELIAAVSLAETF